MGHNLTRHDFVESFLSFSFARANVQMNCSEKAGDISDGLPACSLHISHCLPAAITRRHSDHSTFVTTNGPLPVCQPDGAVHPEDNGSDGHELSSSRPNVSSVAQALVGVLWTSLARVRRAAAKSGQSVRPFPVGAPPPRGSAPPSFSCHLWTAFGKVSVTCFLLCEQILLRSCSFLYSEVK